MYKNYKEYSHIIWIIEISVYEEISLENYCELKLTQGFECYVTGILHDLQFRVLILLTLHSKDPSVTYIGLIPGQCFWCRNYVV